MPDGSDDFQCFLGFEVAFTWVSKAEAASGHTLLLTGTNETLGYGQQMPAGYALVSPTGAYNLQMGGDGNLRIFNGAGTVVWHTNTAGNSGAFLVMQTDGHLVLRRANGTVLWDRPTTGYVANSRLVMQDDGNLVVYKPGSGYTWHRFCNCLAL